ncbi:MAG: molybdopterin-dependent oxidoreductase, partial [Alphaproteobacteria bacterium]
MELLREKEQNKAAGSAAILKSVCRSCHGGCGALLHVADDRLIKVEGDPDSPLNRGRLCPIGAATMDLVYHPDRLKYPMRRVGPRGKGEWQRISWDEALGEIARRLLAIREEFGAEAIALGTGTGRHHIRWVSRFGHALGTPNWCEPGFAQCFHPRVNTSILTFGDFPVGDFSGGTPPECVVYWGHNPVNSGPDGETRFNVRDVLAHKPKIIVVDPRRTFLAGKADLWLQLRPGTDDALALAMLNVLIADQLYDAPFVAEWTHGFEALAERVRDYTPEWAEPITWVPAEKIRAAARLYGETRPSMMEWGCAIEHTPNCIQTIRAVSMLPALTGNVDVPGGWVFGMHGLGRFPSLIENLSQEMNDRRLGADRFKLLSGDGADLPAAHIPTLLQAMREGVPYPVKAFLVFGNNTLTTYGNTRQAAESLAKLDLMVVADLFMTPTAELADFVLPAASWPELDQVAGLPTVAANVVLAQQKAVQIGECRADEEIFVDLARRMNLDVG